MPIKQVSGVMTGKIGMLLFATLAGLVCLWHSSCDDTSLRPPTSQETVAPQAASQSSPPVLPPVFLSHLSTDFSTSAFTCMISVMAAARDTENPKLIYGISDETSRQVRVVEFPKGLMSMVPYYFPLSKAGVLTYFMPRTRPKQTYTIQQYDPRTDQWSVLMTHPVARQANGGLTMPVAWSPDANRFLYCKLTTNETMAFSMWVHDISSGEDARIAQNVWVDVPVYWRTDGWIYFGRHKQERDGYYVGDIYRINDDTHVEQEVTDLRTVVGYTLDPTSDEIVLAEKPSAGKTIVIARVALDGSGYKECFSVSASPDPWRPTWQPTVAEGRIVATTAYPNKGQWDLRLVVGHAHTPGGCSAQVQALRDRNGNLVRGRSPGFVRSQRFVFIGPSPSDSTAFNDGHFENEWLYEYDFSTRAVTKLPMKEEWFSN